MAGEGRLSDPEGAEPSCTEAQARARVDLPHRPGHRVRPAGAFKQRLAELGITQRINRPGTINDNAYIESFFHSMKSDIVHGVRFKQDDEIKTAVRNYVPFYNSTRIHSSLKYVPPATFERSV